jgi:hypothetical protein
MRTDSCLYAAKRHGRNRKVIIKLSSRLHPRSFSPFGH